MNNIKDNPYEGIYYSKYIVVMLSGGLDSTYTAYKMLRDTKDDTLLHIHHCEQRKGNVGDQWRMETIQVPKIIAWLRKEFPKRNIQVSTSRFEYRNSYWSGWDITHFTIFSIDVAKSIYAQNIGAEISIALGIEKNLTRDDGLSYRMDEYMEVFKAMTSRMNTKPEFIKPIVHMDRFDIIADIPPELRELTWSCRSPQRAGATYIKCGRCHACKEIAVVEGRLDKRHLKCMAGGI